MEIFTVFVGKKSDFLGMTFSKIEEKMVGESVNFDRNNESTSVGEVLNIYQANGNVYAEIRVDKSKLPLLVEEEESFVLHEDSIQVPNSKKSETE